MASKHRRHTYLIKTGFQLRYMGIIVATMMTVAVLVGWVIYFTSWNRISSTPDLTVDKLADIFDEVNASLIKWIVLMILIISVLSVFVSHKIAGPVYRLERSAKIIASGDLTHAVRLRRGDELAELSEAFNSMTEALRKMVHKDREIIGRLVGMSNRISDQLKQKKLDPVELERLAKELYSVTEELRLVTTGFNVDAEAKKGDDTEAPAATADKDQATA